jgi:hypothetical protein
METITTNTEQLVEDKQAETHDWYAWLDTTPPKPDELHVIGEITVGNPGIAAVLRKRIPQGINPRILLLDLHLMQQPGMWPQIVTCLAVRYDAVIIGRGYTEVDVLYKGELIAQIPVDIVT